MALLFYIIVGAITFIAFLYAFLKKEIEVSRTVVINKPKTEVFDYIRKLSNQPNWMGFMAQNANKKIKYLGEDGKVGAISHWRKNEFLGKGFQKISKLREGKVIENRIHLYRSPKSKIFSFMATKEIIPGKTKMILGIKATVDFPAVLFLTFGGKGSNLDKELEKSLLRLKSVLENKNL